MRPALIFVPCLVALALVGLPATALAQTQARADDALSAPRLPVPPIDEGAPASAFVVAARTAIAAGRAGEALEAIERAESRVLIRSVRPSRAATPSDQALVRLLADARAALRQGERAIALDMLAQAAADPGLDAAVE